MISTQVSSTQKNDFPRKEISLPQTLVVRDFREEIFQADFLVLGRGGPVAAAAAAAQAAAAAATAAAARAAAAGGRRGGAAGGGGGGGRVAAVGVDGAKKGKEKMFPCFCL